MSYTRANAETYHKWVRDFFGKGSKSDNKRYDAEPAEGQTLKANQAATRNANQELAVGIRNTIHEKKALLKGRTPAMMGELIFKSKLRGGNCAEMTWLCCYAFRTKQLNTWVAIIKDPGDHQFCIFSAKKPNYESINAMKYLGEDQWIIDPWANIVCKPGEFSAKMTEKLQRWTARGKRIGIANEDQSGYRWVPGTDPDYLKNMLTSGLDIRSGG